MTLASLYLYTSNLLKGHLQEYKGSKLAFCSMPLLILNHFTNIQIPDENPALFHFSLSILMFSVALFGAIFNLFLTISIVLTLLLVTTIILSSLFILLTIANII